MRPLLRCAVLGILTLGVISNAQTGDNAGNSSSGTQSDTIVTSGTAKLNSSSIASVTHSLGNGTCLSRTANYITHTLPQQCLRTDRVAANATKTSGPDNTSSTNSTVSTSTQVVYFETTAGSPLRTSSNVESGWITSETSTATSSEASKTASTDASYNIPPEIEGDADSPLDNANFLSFEEWKKRNQPAGEQGSPPVAGDRQRPGVNNALDSFGDEGEIDLDFSGFGGAATGPRQQQAAYRTAEGTASGTNAPTSYTPRSKDAGKTCKERTNYASFDCAATILKTNPECKSASSVLVENKDSYMLNTCAASNKFFIVELCNDILIDTIVLANYEFFSSIFRHFRVSVSDRYPVKMDKWKDLGTYEARNSRDVQAFLIEHPQIWARYLRIEFLSHYGSEYYCPVSLLRVHGTTMLEELRPQDETAHRDNVEEEPSLETEASASPIVAQEASATNDVKKAAAVLKDEIEDSPSDTAAGRSESITTPTSEIPSTLVDSGVSADNRTDLILSVEMPKFDEMTCATEITPPTEAASSDSESLSGSNDTEMDDSKRLEDPNTSETAGTVVAAQSSNANRTETATSSDMAAKSFTSSEASSNASTPASAPVPASSSSPPSTQPAAGDAKSSETALASAASSVPSSSRTSASTSLSVAQPQPSTQESFFKSIQKRLQQLESNSTLSLQYIEEQSRILRDAFSKVEKRQVSATTTFLSSLNDTVMTELRGFRQAYDQLWQSTVIELDGQREQYQREMLALSSRLTLVADELVWQKRMGIVQSLLLFMCLGLVLFVRNGSAGYLEVPLMQQMMNKSQTALNRAQGWESPPASPSPEGRSPVSLFRRKLWRVATEPGHATDATGTDSRPESKDGPLHVLNVNVHPPTPDRHGLLLTPESEIEADDDAGGDADDEDEIGDTREIQSGPPTPTGKREIVREEEPPDIDGFGIGVGEVSLA